MSAAGEAKDGTSRRRAIARVRHAIVQPLGIYTEDA